MAKVNIPNNEDQQFEMVPTGIYDAHVKRFFTLKVIIAYLLKQCVQEQGASIEEFYNKIHKVYSIWICYNVSGPYENTKAEKMQVFSKEYNINDKVIAKEVEEMNAYVLDYAASYAERAVARARAEERDVALRLGEEREARGREVQAKATALTMQKLGMSVDIIAECIGIDKVVVKEWLQGVQSQ